MNIIKQLCRTFVLSAVAVALSVGLMGCPPNDVPDDTPVVKGMFTDSRDGKTYGYVVIGSKTWMSENLNYATGESWCQENSSDSCAKYGKLYTWDAAVTACPSGWLLPDTSDWNRLEIATGESSTAGKALKSTNGWYGDGNGTNSYGFSALPGGHRDPSSGAFRDAGYHAGWWSATEGGDDYAYGRGMGYNYDGLAWVASCCHYKSYAFSVRCVKNN